MSYVYAFLGFSALIILHEAGHFAVAKAVGMRVERFSLFFGPMLVKVRRGETDYGIGPIPLGGYVKISGMNPNEELPPEVVPRAYYNQPPWKRIAVILAGPVVNLVIAFIVLAIIFGQQGHVVTRGGQPVPGPIARAGLEQPAATFLRPGDQIVSIDGRTNLSLDQVTKLVSSHHCAGTPTPGCVATTPVSLTVSRSGVLHQFKIYPRYDPTLKRTRLGVEFQYKLAPVGPFGAARDSLSQMWYVTHTTISTFARIFEPKVRHQLHGVVGGFTVTQERFAYSSTDAFYTLALISLSLAVVNLFPFLPLDGGHVFWAVAEKLRGRRIRFETMERAGVVGFVLIIFIFVIGLSNDISTLTGTGFNAR